MARKATKAKKPGRPRGSKNIDRPADPEENVLSNCPKCGSTRKKTVSQSPIVQFFEGVHNGKPFNRIVRRRVICSDCGQHRMDITREFVPDKT